MDIMSDEFIDVIYQKFNKQILKDIKDEIHRIERIETGKNILSKVISNLEEEDADIATEIDIDKIDDEFFESLFYAYEDFIASHIDKDTFDLQYNFVIHYLSKHRG